MAAWSDRGAAARPMATMLLVATAVGASAYHAPVTSPRALNVRSRRAMASVEPEGVKTNLGPVVTQGATAWIEAYPDRKIERMRILATEPPMTDEAISSFLDFMTDAMALDAPFTCFWDMSAKGCAFPSMKQFRRVIQYLEEDNRSEKWDELVQGNVAIIRSPILRGAAKLMTAISNPPQPSFICNDEEKALNFAKEKLHEAKDWAH